MGTFQNTDSVGWSNYQALEASLHRVSSGGLSYLLSYTFSKSLDPGCSGSFVTEDCYIQNPYALGTTRAVSAFDLPNIFAGSVVYPIPFGIGRQHRSSNAVMNYALGGWSFSGIARITSGTPFTPEVTSDIANVGGDYVLPEEVANPIPAHRTPNEWFVQGALVAPAADTFGNYPINSLRTANFWDADISIFKSFPIYRESSLDFRADAFDFSNSTVLGTPGTTYGAASYGVISTVANGPRIMQFSAKYHF
jgi:hypothetical protein